MGGSVTIREFLIFYAGVSFLVIFPGFIIFIYRKNKRRRSDKEGLIQENILLERNVEQRTAQLDQWFKPIEGDDIARTVHKIEEDIDKSQNAIGARLHHLEKLLIQNHSSSDSKIGIAMADKIVFADISDIMYCEANGSYTNVCFKDGKKMVVSKSLGDFELQLARHDFFRIHHSSLINLRLVKEYQRHDGGYLIMENGERLEVSQRKRKDFLDAIDHLVV